MMENDRKIMVEEVEERTKFTKDLCGKDHGLYLVLVSEEADYLGWSLSDRINEKYKNGELSFINDGNNYEIKRIYKFIVTRVGDEYCERGEEIEE